MAEVNDFIPGIYKNKNNENYYYAEKIKVDCTNCRDGTLVVSYGDYVRELDEFLLKFELIEADPKVGDTYMNKETQEKLKIIAFGRFVDISFGVVGFDNRERITLEELREKYVKVEN